MVLLVTNYINSESIGAKPQSEWVTMRVDGEALAELAKSGKGAVEGLEK